jgi:hypothetical protein
MMLATGESASLAAMWAGHSGDVQKLYRSQADAYHRDGARDWERGRISLRDFSDEKVKADDGTQESSQ